MAQRSITIEHAGQTFDGQMTTIKSTSLTVEDHGIVTAYLHCEWPGGGIGVGGYCLDTPTKDADGKHLGREGTAYGMDHLMRVMETVGVGTWEKLPGKHVIVLFNAGGGGWGGMSVGIAHPTDDKKVLILKDHAAEWMARETTTPAAEREGVSAK